MSLLSITTRADGDILTAARYNADRQEIADALTASYVDDSSASTTAMRTKTDPGEVGSESLPTTLQGEIERIRYGIYDAKLTQDPNLAQWYTTPLKFGNMIDVKRYATSGAGTLASPWAGWATAIDWTVSSQTIYFAPGYYSCTASITISGKRNHIVGAGKHCTFIKIIPSATMTAGVFSFNSGSAINFQSSLKGLSLYTTDTTYRKIGISLIDTSEFHMSDVVVGEDGDWAGDTSRALVIKGREAGTIEQCTFCADMPIQISDNPNNSIDIDQFTFRDMYCIATNSTNACINIDPGVNLSNVNFEGWNEFVRGSHVVYWNDNTGSIASFSLTFKNMRWEQSTNTSGYMFYLAHNSSLQNVIIENVYCTPLANGVYLRNCRNVSIRHMYYPQAGGTSLDATTSSYPITLDNCFFQTGSSISSGSLSQVYDAGRFASTHILSRIYDASNHAETILTAGGTSYTPVARIASNTTSQATTGTTEETLATLTLPAGTFTANGQFIRVKAAFTTANNANTKVARIRWNGTGGTNAAAVSVATASVPIILSSDIIRTGSSAQTLIGVSTAKSTAIDALVNTDTINTASDVVIYIRGETGTSAGDLTFQAAWIEFYP